MRSDSRQTASDKAAAGRHMEVRPARAGDFHELMAMMTRSFRADHDGEFDFARAFPDVYRPADEEMSWSLTARIDGRIAGCVTAAPLALSVGREVIEIGGIGGVCTHPDYRGRGVMRRLMDETFRRMAEEQRYPFAWLGGDRRRFRPWGFERMPNGLEMRLEARAPGIARYTAGEAWSVETGPVAKADWDILWRELSTVPYFAACGPDRLRMKYDRARAGKLLVSRAAQADCAGHILVEPDGSLLHAWAGDPEAVGVALAQGIRERGWTPNVVCSLKPDPYTEVFDALCGNERKVVPLGSLSILSLFRTLSVFKAGLDQRVSAGCIRGRALLSMEGFGCIGSQSVYLEADGKELTISDAQSGASPAPERTLSPWQMSALLFSCEAPGRAECLAPGARWLAGLVPLPLYLPGLYGV